MLIDQHTLRHGRHDDTVGEHSDGSVLPAESARRLACDANILPVVLEGDDQPLDVARSRRLATRAQRTALRAMYPTCAIDGCDRHFDRCHIHHLVEWDQLGTTDLVNLLPPGGFHHHRAHEGRWRLQLDSSARELSVHLATGELDPTSLPTCWSSAPPPDDALSRSSRRFRSGQRPRRSAPRGVRGVR